MVFKVFLCISAALGLHCVLPCGEIKLYIMTKGGQLST